MSVRANPPERRQRPVVLAGACGATTTTTSSCSVHSLGGVLGAVFGARRATQTVAAAAADDRAVARRAAFLYFVVLVVCAAATFQLSDARRKWLVLLILPGVQLLASVVSAAAMPLLFRSRRSMKVAFDAIATITGFALLGAIGGGLIMIPLTVLFLLLGDGK